MLRWMQHSQFPKLAIKFYSQNYRGVVARQAIAKGEVLLVVPEEYMITLEKAADNAMVARLKEQKTVLTSPKHSQLSMYLLAEMARGQDSFYYPYTRLLPQDLGNFPVFFSEETLAWLKGSFFYEQVLEKREDIVRDYRLICEAVPEFAQFSLKDYTWGRMMAASRIFGLTISGTKTDAFIPLADMLNHRVPKQTSWKYSPAHNGFIIEALEDIPRGADVYDSYGSKCNSRFFLNYGFVLGYN
jgi:histone-lysine N-methyltransferase SETD3